MSKWLYKRDTTGEVRQWKAEVEKDRYRMTAGLLNGKHVTSEWSIAQPKNVGRANATTAEEQAKREVEQLYTKKKKEGYTEDVGQIDAVALIKPMLAKKYLDYEEDIKYPVFAQPKLDGIRCIVTTQGLLSRKNEPLLACPHIHKLLVPLCALYGIRFDGELYNHHLKDDFNAIQSFVMKKAPTKEDVKATEGVIYYYCYDLLDTTRTFSERQALLKDIWLTHNVEINSHFVLVGTTKIENKSELDSHYESVLRAGYEGQMVRLDAPYEHKRSSTLLKRKNFEDAEFPIAYVEEGVGNRSGMVGRVTLKLPDGRTFGAGVKGGVEVNRFLLSNKDKLPGKMATIVYQNLTPDGIPRFPVFKALREDI